MADDFFDQMNLNADVGSQYGGSQFEGFDDLDENDVSFTQPTPQSPSVKRRAKQQRPLKISQVLQTIIVEK